MKNRFFSIIFLTLFIFAQASAQKRYISSRRPSRAVPGLQANNYLDSLKIYKAKLDSMQLVNDSLAAENIKKNDSRFYRLFSPLAFYPEITGREINGSVSKSDDLYDELADATLLHTYKNRPDLVRTTVSRLHRSAAVGDIAPTQPVRHKVEVMKEVEPVKEDLLEQGDVNLMVFKPNFWTFSADYSLQFLQNYISKNWYKGGESNLSMVGAATMKLNYNNKQKVKFENTLEMRLGMQTSESDTLHTLKTSTDQLRYTGKLGLQAIKKWDYTAQLIATTQFMRGYKSNDNKVYSDFLSPLEVNLSLGMDYNVITKNKKFSGTVHLAPLAYNMKYVSRLALSTRYGIEEGEHMLHDYGSQFNVNLTWKPVETIKWSTRLYGYTTYHRAVVEWENTVSFAFSKYISTTLYFYPRFDDSAKKDDDLSYWQIKEYFSLGFSYSL